MDPGTRQVYGWRNRWPGQKASGCYPPAATPGGSMEARFQHFHCRSLGFDGFFHVKFPAPNASDLLIRGGLEVCSVWEGVGKNKMRNDELLCGICFETSRKPALEFCEVPSTQAPAEGSMKESIDTIKEAGNKAEDENAEACIFRVFEAYFDIICTLFCEILTFCSPYSHLLSFVLTFFVTTLFSPFLLILTFFLTFCSPSYQLILTFFSAYYHLMFTLFSPHRILTLCLPYSHIVLTHSVLILTLFWLDVHVIIPLFWSDFSVILTLFLPGVHLFPPSHRILSVCFTYSDPILTFILTLFSHFPHLLLNLLSLISPYVRLFPTFFSGTGVEM